VGGIAGTDPQFLQSAGHSEMVAHAFRRLRPGISDCLG
jgi:hypothetical protein